MRSLLLTTLCLACGITVAACSSQSPVIDNIQTEESNIESPISAFTAFGNSDKSWRAVIDGDEMSVEAEFLKPATVVVARSAYAKGVEFIATVDGSPITININGQPCTDDNGQENEFTATLSYKGKSYKGCAVAGAIETAPT
jgi:uncharacterized membrane protein